MKKKVKKTQGKRTRGHSKRPQVPIHKPSTAPSWHRPWILTSTDEYDERTVSAERYAESEAYYKRHGFTPRTEEEEEQYNLFLQQEYYELGARDRERAASYAEAAQYQATKANKEAERRKQIALKAATKKNKKEAEARAAADRKAAARKEAERAQALCRQFLSKI